MTVKRCRHTISINAGMLKRIISTPKTTMVYMETIDYRIEFRNDMTEEDKKELANFLITNSIVKKEKAS